MRQILTWRCLKQETTGLMVPRHQKSVTLFSSCLEAQFPLEVVVNQLPRVQIDKYVYVLNLEPSYLCMSLTKGNFYGDRVGSVTTLAGTRTVLPEWVNYVKQYKTPS